MGGGPNDRARREPVEADDDASVHRVLWTDEPSAHPSSSAPPSARSDDPSGTQLVLVPRALEQRGGQRIARATRRALDPRLVLLAEPDSVRTEAFRALCDNLIAKDLPRILAVTSGARHEGKTTCSINLALALAEQSLGRILLVDGNFFAPALAGIFSLDEDEPFEPSARLRSEPPFELCELGPRLHVATIVQRRDEPKPRLGKLALDVILTRLCSDDYEHVIIDAPGLEGSLLVGQLVAAADGILLTVRAGHTTTGALRHAIDQLPRERTLGVALIDTEPS